MKKLLVAALLLGMAGTANAAVVSVEIVSHLFGSPRGTPSSSAINAAPGFPGDFAQLPMPSCTYDDVANSLACNGVFDFRTRTGTGTTYSSRHFDRFITNLNITNGSAAGSTAYECIDGGFGALVGASMCGNYLWGANYVNDSTVSYGPGLAFSRTLGGDDTVAGAQQSINDYNLAVASYDGATLVFQSADWTSSGGASGLQMNFRVVPVPAAAWLFGAALATLGAVRRRLK
ncbi:MAG: VPLPA-CTERM sorting domain-containing protein [Gammaproteobacteria bacterium]|nr:VPLPA-CTERM sorting domain-containing protein [Gammaproteobacteria bacterium]